ncbi:hypothetical protein OESDEN_04677 [Oesophagostomum dentatum]|uniref:Serpin domain-containing protein n=1 Tax=Oesophagostomum dentatum TaxID=61180 RepID=A0A0B1TDM2_OESDE|nr:hypothetical protein OESDEN_04677 [Oesophagostomum dentatum]
MASNASIESSETNFGLDMIRQLPASEVLVVSPLSVIFALTMIQVGAKGKTKAQINQVVSKDASDNEITSFYSKLSQEIARPSNGAQTRIANAFFLDKKFNIEQNYADIITRKYAAKVQALNFAQTAQTAKTVNAFVSNATAGEIDDLITEDLVKSRKHY